MEVTDAMAATETLEPQHMVATVVAMVATETMEL